MRARGDDRIEGPSIPYATQYWTYCKTCGERVYDSLTGNHYICNCNGGNVSSTFDYCLTLNQWSAKVADGVKKRGFVTPKDIGVCATCGQDPMIAKLGLVGTEISEAIEAARKGDRENFDEEIADVFIRLFDICGAMGINIDRLVFEKEQKNSKRPPLHGKTC